MDRGQLADTDQQLAAYNQYMLNPAYRRIKSPDDDNIVAD